MLDGCRRSLREKEEAAARAAEQQKVRETERAKEQAALEAARAKRDPNDVVEQVLNYTITGSDQGTENNFWFKPDASQRCVYERVSGIDETDNKIADVVNIFAMVVTSAVDLKAIDLDRLAVNGLGIEYADRFNQYILTHDGQPLFLISRNADPERVKRGWMLIYEEAHCRGLKRAF